MPNLTAYDFSTQQVVEFAHVLDFISFKLKQLEDLNGERRDDARRYVDDIWEQALQAIAEGEANPQAIAWAALQTRRVAPRFWLDVT